MARLTYLSNATVEGLRENILANAERYRSGDFFDMAKEGGEWSIELKLDVDLSPLMELDPSGSPDAEIMNSQLVWQALGALSPALAYEEAIWVRLTHVECLEYSRKRWLMTGLDQAQLEKSVRLHFFASTLNGRRDDNAISRLWWNAYIANQISPEDIFGTLTVLLRRADIRANIVERSLTGSRSILTAGIIRASKNHGWLTESEDNFRSFMRALNRLGGGVVFEAVTSQEIDNFMQDCAVRAGMPASTLTPANLSI